MVEKFGNKDAKKIYFSKQMELCKRSNKAKEEAKWDGLKGVITNDRTTKAIDLLHKYRSLWVDDWWKI